MAEKSVIDVSSDAESLFEGSSNPTIPYCNEKRGLTPESELSANESVRFNLPSKEEETKQYPEKRNENKVSVKGKEDNDELLIQNESILNAEGTKSVGSHNEESVDIQDESDSEDIVEKEVG